MQQLIEVLIESYGFELNEESSEELARRWLEEYDSHWIRLAIIEALYLGRYKAFSVEQILNLWSRRGRARFHFTHEFERLICRRLPKALREFSEEVVVEDDDDEEDISLSNPTAKDLEEEEMIQEEADPEPEEEETTDPPFSINRFTPLLDRSHIYSKLKAVVESDYN